MQIHILRLDIVSEGLELRDISASIFQFQGTQLLALDKIIKFC